MEPKTNFVSFFISALLSLIFIFFVVFASLLILLLALLWLLFCQLQLAALQHELESLKARHAQLSKIIAEGKNGQRHSDLFFLPCLPCPFLLHLCFVTLHLSLHPHDHCLLSSLSRLCVFWLSCLFAGAAVEAVMQQQLQSAGSSTAGMTAGGLMLGFGGTQRGGSAAVSSCVGTGTSGAVGKSA